MYTEEKIINERYVIKKKISSGSYGIVYKITNTFVATKLEEIKIKDNYINNKGG